MEVSSEMLLYLLTFAVGIFVGLIIMTEVKGKQNDKLLVNLLDLDDNVHKYKTEIQKLIVQKRNIEIELKLYKIREEQRKETAKFLES
jgi:uncharacterized membrane-anchored protein YhcB (DUF1043 family)